MKKWFILLAILILGGVAYYCWKKQQDKKDVLDSSTKNVTASAKELRQIQFSIENIA